MYGPTKNNETLATKYFRTVVSIAERLIGGPQNSRATVYTAFSNEGHESASKRSLNKIQSNGRRF
jgi:hypothetical protein